jgi:hypothetical protein
MDVKKKSFSTTFDPVCVNNLVKPNVIKLYENQKKPGHQ